MHEGGIGQGGVNVENFEFYAPTRMIFGKDTHLKVGKLIREYGFKKVLIHFGGGSVKRTGLLDTVCRSLEEEGIGYVLLGRRSGQSGSFHGKKGY